MFSYHRNDAEEKPRQKRGVADVYFHFQSIEFFFFPGLDVLPLPITPSTDGTSAGQN